MRFLSRFQYIPLALSCDGALHVIMIKKHATAVLKLIFISNISGGPIGLRMSYFCRSLSGLSITVVWHLLSQLLCPHYCKLYLIISLSFLPNRVPINGCLSFSFITLAFDIINVMYQNGKKLTLIVKLRIERDTLNNSISYWDPSIRR